MKKIAIISLLIVISIVGIFLFKKSELAINDEVILSNSYVSINKDRLYIGGNVSKIMHDAFTDCKFKKVIFENKEWYVCDKYKCMHPILINLDKDANKLLEQYKDYDWFIKN